MIKLQQSLSAWDSPEFRAVFKAEISSLSHNLLPLQAGLSYSSYVSNDAVDAVILTTNKTQNAIIIKASLFYSGIIAGCSCADDPTPLDTQNEQCDVLFTINTDTAETEVTLLTD